MISTCPHCGKRWKINDDFAGRQTTCTVCKQIFTITKVSSDAAQKQQAARTPPTTGQVTAPGSNLQSPPVRSSPDPQATGGIPTPPPMNEIHGVGPKYDSAPPPLPMTSTATPTQGPAKLPPFSTKVVPKVKAPDISASVALNQVADSLVRALCIRKLGFFVLVEAVIILFCGPLLWIAVSSVNNAVDTLCFFLIAVIITGAVGLLPGGVAHLTHQEKQGNFAGISDAFAFCRQRFLSLLGGEILLLIILYVTALVVNGSIMLLDLGLGSLIGTLLFLPQFIVNFVLVLVAAVGVLIPCAIAVEDIGAFRALSRLTTCLRHNTSQLMVQLAMTALFGASVMMVLFLLVNMAMFPSLSSTLYSSRFDISVIASAGMKLFFIGVIWLLVMAYPAVYWIVSFTTYYETVQPKISGIVGALK